MASDLLTYAANAGDHAVPFAWLDLPVQPLDLNGPTTRHYRRLDPSWIEQPIFESFLCVAEAFADRVAVDDMTRQLSFRELRDGACRLARALTVMATAGEPVGILLPNDAHYPVAVLGCLAAGHPCVLLDINYPLARSATIIADAGIGAIIVVSGDAERVPAGLATIPIELAFAGTRDSTPIFDAALAPDVPAFIIYTSGSTGQPKGIALAQRTFVHRSRQLIDALHLNAEDKMMPLGSPCTVAGLLQMFEALLAGATLVKIDLQRAGLGVVLDAIQQKRATTLLATPALLRSLCRLDQAAVKMASLRCVHAAGDVLLSVDVDYFRRCLSPDCLLLVTYGATEAPAMGHWFVTSDASGGGARVASGYPLPDYCYAVLDDNGKPATGDEPGELVVSSRYTALGEWHNGRLVPGRITADSGDPGSRVLRTGDLVHRHADGLITILGRKDRLVKIRGMRVEPYEVECALRRSTDILDASVLVRHVDENAALVAFVVLSSDANNTAIDGLRADLRQALPAYMQPVRINAVDTLPLLPGHKIDTEKLAALDDAQIAERLPAAALASACGGPTRTTLALVEDAWEQVLDRPSFEADLAFDQSGGNSLSLLMLVCDLEKRCGIQLPLLQFDLAMRPSEMARAIDTIIANTAVVPPRAGLILLKPGTKGPAVFMTHGLGGHGGELMELARQAACDHPIYALQLPGLAGDERALERIEDMATQFVDLIREAEPEADCLLVGYSLGGLIAFEIACRLEASGRETRLLLLDTFPHPHFWPLAAWLGHLAARAGVHTRLALQCQPNAIPVYARNLVRSMVDHLRERCGLRAKSRTSRWLVDAPALRRVRTGMVTARGRFRPTYYPRAITFVQPESRQTGAPEQPMAAWRGCLGGLDVFRVPGDHVSMIMRHADATAELLDRWVERCSP